MAMGVVRTLASVCVFMAAGLLSPSARAVQVGVVDVQKALESLEHYRDAKARVEKAKTEMEREIKAEQAALEEKDKKLAAKEGISEKGAMVKEREAFMQEVQSFQQKVQVSEQKLQSLRARVTTQLLQRIQACTQLIAQNQNLDFVFRAGNEAQPNVLYHVAPLDLTDRVVKVYRERFAETPLELD